MLRRRQKDWIIVKKIDVFWRINRHLYSQNHILSYAVDSCPSFWHISPNSPLHNKKENEAIERTKHVYQALEHKNASIKFNEHFNEVIINSDVGTENIHFAWRRIPSVNSITVDKALTYSPWIVRHSTPSTFTEPCRLAPVLALVETLAETLRMFQLWFVGSWLNWSNRYYRLLGNSLWVKDRSMFVISLWCLQLVFLVVSWWLDYLEPELLHNIETSSFTWHRSKLRRWVSLFFTFRMFYFYHILLWEKINKSRHCARRLQLFSINIAANYFIIYDDDDGILLLRVPTEFK